MEGLQLIWALQSFSHQDRWSDLICLRGLPVCKSCSPLAYHGNMLVSLDPCQQGSSACVLNLAFHNLLKIRQLMKLHELSSPVLRKDKDIPVFYKSAETPTIPDKTTWESFPHYVHFPTQQNYFQNDSFAERKPLPPIQCCFLQTPRDQSFFWIHNNIAFRGRGRGKNRSLRSRRRKG